MTGIDSLELAWLFTNDYWVQVDGLVEPTSVIVVMSVVWFVVASFKVLIGSLVMLD